MTGRTSPAVVSAASLALVSALTLTASSPAEAAVGSALPKTTTFYVDPSSGPARWAATHPRDVRTSTIKSNVASKPMARWFGDWSGKIGPSVNTYVKAAAKKKQTPILVAYNLPGRDACGLESAGGAETASGYRTWVKSFAAGIGQGSALVILEPDALADLDLDCLSADEALEREELLAYATQQFRKSAPNALVYLDAGHSNYASAQDMSQRLVDAGISNVRGFSLNVSNFRTTAQENAFAAELNAELRKLGSRTKPYVIDTSRNGAGSNGQWCNPKGRKIGVSSRITVNQNQGTPEARLWIKTPGQSDGKCGIAPKTKAGAFDPQIAYNLVRGT